MMSARLLRNVVLAAAILTWLVAARAGADPEAPPAPAGEQRESAEYFEKQVRPIFVEHCQSCHGEKKQEAGLRLDSATAVRQGSDSGPVIVAGAPDESLLIEAVRHDGPTKMPPKKKLPDSAIAALERWVRSGAVWPETGGSQTAASSIAEKAKTHWSFQPIVERSLPSVRDAAWCREPVDAFILARLEAADLKPSPRADRATLIRRATFDLHGLPPTAEEVAAFEADASPDAWRRLIERLLESPRYGERWGRHWLDVARYSDTKGYVRLRENPNYVGSWTYRDYVVRTFNEDLAYDRFLVEQLAADQLDLGEDPRALAALGFLTLGQRFINSQHDIIDDRIDVVMRGLLGLTVTCARCHDHKFDPIPTRDYYSLHGVFASSVEPRVPPMILPENQRPAFASYLTELENRSRQLDDFLKARQAELSEQFRTRLAEYLLAGQREQVQANFLAVMFLIDAAKDLNPVMVQRLARLLEQSRKRGDRVLAPWHEMAALAASEAAAHQAAASDNKDPAAGPEAQAQAAERLAAKIAGIVAGWRENPAATGRFNPAVVEALTRNVPRDLAGTAQVYTQLIQKVDDRWKDTIAARPEATALDDANLEEIRQTFFGTDGPLTIALDDLDDFLFVDTTRQNQLHDHQRLVEDWIATSGAAPHAMVLVDARRPADSRVFIRGNASNPGEVVPRRVPGVLARGEQHPFEKGSGRLELARAIASSENPLTARVFVNRVWMHHFGAGLVRTPGDFGLRGEPPTHPELLDELSRRFIAGGWSVKNLHRMIMLSATYQQQSRTGDSPEHARARERDPENLWLWKMNRRRLDWESLHDSLLAVSGRIDLTTGGPAVELFQPPFSRRRAIYGVIDRQNLASALRTFDFAPPDATNPQRHQTTVPQQALFLLNSPFLKQCAQSVAARPELAGLASVRDRIDAAHRILLGRPAQADEIALGEKYLESAGPAEKAEDFTAWEEFLQTLLLSNEFVFVD